MTDFASRLRAQKKALEDETLSQEEKLAVKRTEENAKFAEQVDLLRSLINPILERCQHELRKEGMSLRISDNFEVQPHLALPTAALQVFCGSPARKSDGYIFESRPLFIDVKGEQFGVGIGDKYARLAPNDLTPVSRNAVEDKIQESLLVLTGEALGEWQSSPARNI